MRTDCLAAPFAAALALCGCVAVAPPLMAVPGGSKTQEAFRQDQAACGQEASQAAYPNGASHAPATSQEAAAAWQRYDAAYAQCLVSHGDKVQPVPYAGYGYPGGYGYADPYGYGDAYGFGYGPYGFYDGLYGGFYPGFGFGYGGFGYGRFGYGRFGYGHFGYGGGGFGRGGWGGGFGHGGFGGGFGGHGGGGHR